MWVGMNVGPYMAYILYISFLSFIQKGGFWGPTNFHHKLLAFFGHFDYQIGWFFKAITLFKTIFEN